MAFDTVDAFLEQLHASRLLSQTQADEIERDVRPRCADARALARELIQRGWLTPYQVNQLSQGKGNELILGSYRVLERLGVGGMGQVFKARHQTLGRVVALKLIRKEHLTKPDAIHRFQREIRAAAQLSHPNIVMAYDADQVGDHHFYVMEYVEGSDLSRIVKESGPVAVAVACEYVRQAALGLQHAHERGLVHRDIKPANLLISREHAEPSSDSSWSGATVKILDMGLARLVADDNASSLSWKTQEGKVLGTPDYMAPEQALKSSTADVRADLYSLGCTLHYLLTGGPPFPGGTLMEKLLKHKLDEPVSVEKLRPEVPRAVGAVIRKLMAKKPEDRYQTPAELADALGHVLAGLAPQNGAPPAQETFQPTGETMLTETVFEVPILKKSQAAFLSMMGERNIWLALLGVVALFLLGFVLLVAVLVWHQLAKPNPRRVSGAEAVETVASGCW